MSSETKNRRVLALGTLGAVILSVVLVRSSDEPAAPTGEPLLPDLWASEPFELTTDTINGRHVIRFTSEINNRGRGDLIIRGNAKTAVVAQWIAHSESGFSVQPLDAEVVWGGDTHFHWHIDAVARYWVEPIDGGGDTTRADNKVGFCVFDGVDRQTSLPGAPDDVRYAIDGCGGRLDSELSMGLSVGWGDQYRFTLTGQWIDIDDLAGGRYRLGAEVDPDGLFAETDRSNNIAYTEFTLLITSTGERVLLG